MITQPSDYEFVDFANGDMPTGNFNGQVMPLRQGAAQDTLKAEDVAFLQEAYAERVAAWYGVEYRDSYGSLVTYPAYPGDTPSIVPTRRILGRQMGAIYSDALSLASSTGGGVRGYWQGTSFGARYGRVANLTTAVASWISPYLIFDDGAAIRQAIPSGSFSPGAKVAKAPVVELYNFLTDFARPVFGDPWNRCLIDTRSYGTLAATGGWTDTPILTDSHHWGFERNPYDKSKSMYVYPQTQGVLYIPQAGRHLDYSNTELWYLLHISGYKDSSVDPRSYIGESAFVDMPHTVEIGTNNRKYVRVGGDPYNSGRDFLLKFISIMQSFGIDYLSESDPYVQVVDMEVVGALFVAGLDSHTKWWS